MIPPVINPQLAAQACQNNDYKTLATYLDMGLNPNEVISNFKLNCITKAKVPLLCIAALNGSVECIDVLLNYKANIECEDETGSRPVHCACLTGNSLALRRLLDRGADPNPSVDSVSLLFIFCNNSFAYCCEARQDRVCEDSPVSRC